MLTLPDPPILMYYHEQPTCLPTDLALVKCRYCERRFFEAKIRPVFIEHCEKCHNASKQQGGFRLDSKDNFFKGPDSGPIFNPTKPSESKILKLLHYQSELKMPPRASFPIR